MLSLYVSPLKFDNKKNEIKIGDEKIEWKKQVATVSKKKGLAPVEYLNDKYGSKVGNNGSITFAHFDYNDNSSIYLLYTPNPNKKPIELTYDLYIPHDIEIVEESHEIEASDSGIIIHGDVYGFCLDNETYYFKHINVDEYIEFVQKDNNVAEEDDPDNLNDDGGDDSDYVPDDSEDESADDNDDSESDSEDEENEIDDEGLYDDDNDDIIEDKKDSKKPISPDDSDAEPEEEGMGDEDEEEDEDAEDEQAVASVAGDDEEGTGDIEVEEFVELDDADNENSALRKKKTRFAKSMKLTGNVDFNIILNILEEESKEIITLEANLYNTRKLNIQIFKKLGFPLKTCQMIEKGIYNYTIDRCFNRQVIPLWENQEFVDIYIGKSKSLYINLNDKSYVGNTNLLQKVKKGEVLPYDLAFMDTYKLFPERWIEIMEEKVKKEKMIKDSIQECASDLFECPRCHKRKTIYCEVQTRSSDEPMTKFITCIECGKRWKKY